MTQAERDSLNERHDAFYRVNGERLAMLSEADKAQRKAERLEADLLKAIAHERRAGTRVKRAATLLRKWQATRRRIEKRIGEAEVRRIVNRLSMKVGAE